VLPPVLTLLLILLLALLLVLLLVLGRSPFAPKAEYEFRCAEYE